VGKESHRVRVLVNISGEVCALEVDNDGVPEVLGGGGRAEGEQLDEAKRMACSGTPIASCCRVKARLERL
jgi:hypothetical protein